MEGYEVVYGKRIKREGETFFKKFTAKMFYRLLKSITVIDIPVDTVDFRLIDRKVCEAMIALPERNRYVRGLVSWVGYKQTFVEFERQERFAGETKYSLKKMMQLAFDGITSFSYKPLALLGFIAGAIKENLRLKLDNKRKISLVLWITWLVPEVMYFSFTTGLFHPYYLTMMAPPAAALAGIGITTMWEFYKEGKWKGWLLPLAFPVTGLTHMMMLSYFTSNLSTVVRNVIVISLIICFGASVILAVLKLLNLINEKNIISKDAVIQ